MLSFIIVTILLLICLYYYNKKTNKKIEPFVSASKSKNDDKELRLINELVQDRENYFQFKNSQFAYLKDYQKKYLRQLKNLHKDKKDMERFIKDYQSNQKLLKKISNKKEILKPLYTQHDLNNNQEKIKKLKKIYQSHLNQFVDLFGLNTTILVQQLYNVDSNQKLINHTNKYQRLKTEFNQNDLEM